MCIRDRIFTQMIVRPCSMFYPYEGYRSVTPLDAARVNRTIFHNHSVHWYYITLMRVGIILSTWYEKLKNVSCEYDGLNGWNSTFACCVEHQTRSLDVLILYFIYSYSCLLLLLAAAVACFTGCCIIYLVPGRYDHKQRKMRNGRVLNRMEKFSI